MPRTATPTHGDALAEPRTADPTSGDRCRRRHDVDAGARHRTGDRRRRRELKAIVEALIFASPEPLTPKMLFKLLDDEPKEDVQAALEALKADYERPGGLQLVEVAGGYQIVDAARAARVGAAPVPRADDAEAVGRRRSRRWR